MRRAPLLAFALALVGAAGLPAAARAQSDNPAPDWGAPYCGNQPRITSVYDNDVPLYETNGRTILYSGHDVGASCGMPYDGHSGFDYSRRAGRQACIGGLVGGVGARLAYAVADGVVRRSRWYQADHEKGFGLHVDVTSNGGSGVGVVSHLYGHLAAVFVDEGDAVSRGQAIGAVGTTGNSSGPHLHFQGTRGDRGDVSDVTFDPYGWNAVFGPGYRYPGFPQPHRGNGWPMRALTPGQSGPRCPGDCGTVVIEEDAPTVTYGCRAGIGLSRCPSWHDSAQGHGGRHRWTYPNGPTADYWVTYACPQCAPGSYLVEAYVPFGSDVATTHVARYEAGGRVTVLDQHEEGNEWQPIGFFRFGAMPSVTLSDRTDRYDYVARAPQRIAADAVRFVRACDDGGGAGSGSGSDAGSDDAPRDRSDRGDAPDAAGRSDHHAAPRS